MQVDPTGQRLKPNLGTSRTNQESLIRHDRNSDRLQQQGACRARMTISDQPLEARLRAYESANRYDRPCNALHLVLICCWGPMAANSILTLELISGAFSSPRTCRTVRERVRLAVIHTCRQQHPFQLRALPPGRHDNMERVHGFSRARCREIATDPERSIGRAEPAACPRV